MNWDVCMQRNAGAPSAGERGGAVLVLDAATVAVRRMQESDGLRWTLATRPLAGVSPAVEQTIAYKAKGQAVDFAAF
jgi:hypothetical protein